MNTNSIEALKLIQPVFDFLDGVISDDGLDLFVGFVYALIPFRVWALSGGLRQKWLRGKPMPLPVIVLHLPVGTPPPPTETFVPSFHEHPGYNHDDYPWD